MFFVLINSITVNGQNTADTVLYRVDTKDGNSFIGTILGEDTLILFIKTENLGDLKISKNDVKSIKQIQNVVKVGDKFWLTNPQSSRYFWAPNGYGLMKGEAYYQNIWVLYNQVSFGLANNFSLGVGMMPLFLIAGTATPVWMVPKFSFPLVKNKFNLGAGAFLGTLIGENSGVFGLLYGTSTFGSRDKNFSIGLAYGFAGDEWLNTPVINVSGMVRTGPKGYFITENYAITVEGADRHHPIRGWSHHHPENRPRLQLMDSGFP